MSIVRGTQQDGQLTISLAGRINSDNASQVEAEIMDLTKDYSGGELVIDAKELSYISSAGLRVLLRLRKKNPQIRIIEASTEIYDILDMTGFTQMMTVEKAYQVVSVEGCEVIGKGANGTIYRIDGDNVVKVYNNADALDEILHEREVAKLALVLGVPTAISYDVVRVGDSYGSVFELLDARSISKILAEHPEQMDWCVKEYIKMLKLIHGTVVPKGKLPDLRNTVLEWADFVEEYLPEEEGRKLKALVEAVPVDQHMIHGDYHTNNLQLVDDEVLLIDMDTLAVGHPVFELGSMYNAFVGFGEYDRSVIDRFMGFDADTAKEFWHRSLAAYLDTTDEERIRSVENKARIVGYTRLIRRSIRRGGLDDPEKKAEIDVWRNRLIELLKVTDSLTFGEEEEAEASPETNGPDEIDLEATVENLDRVLAFVDQHLENAGCSMKEQMQIDVAVEEIFVNIANYAYQPDKGNATVRIEVTEEPVVVVITFIDQGVPYDPLAKEDPDITLSAEERQIGGLGIFMVKQSVDDVIYEYKDGRNILTLKKGLANK